MEKVSFSNKEGEKLAGILDGSGESAVIICHGFTGDKDEPFIKALADGLKSDFLILRFDFSGNSESEGSFSDCDYSKQVSDISCAVKFVKSLGCKKIGLVGHSMGAASCILASAKIKINSLVSISAPVFINIKRLKEIAKQYKTDNVSDEFVKDLLNTSIISAVEKRTAPLLVIHGTKDEVINVQEAIELFNHARKPKDMILVDSTNHHFSRKKAVVIKEVSAWMKRWLS